MTAGKGCFIVGGDRRVHPRQPGVERPYVLPRTMSAALESSQGYLARILPLTKDEGVVAKVWSGLVPFSSDGVPVLGRAHDDLCLLTGLCGSGFMRGPMAGYLVSELVTGKLSATVPLLQKVAPSHFKSCLQCERGLKITGCRCPCTCPQGNQGIR